MVLVLVLVGGMLRTVTAVVGGRPAPAWHEGTTTKRCNSCKECKGNGCYRYSYSYSYSRHSGMMGNMELMTRAKDWCEGDARHGAGLLVQEELKVEEFLVGCVGLSHNNCARTMT